MAFSPNMSRVTIAALLLSTASASYAQVPTTADPSKAIRRFDEQPTVPADSVPNNLVRPAPAPSKATEAAAKQLFKLGGVKLEGVTAYPQGAFNYLFESRVGSSVSVADIQNVAAQISDRYRADGYVLALAYVPTQNVGADGMITIRVNEGVVNNVLFEGDKPDSKFSHLVQDYADKIKAQRPLKASALERYLLLINDLPGTHAQAVLRPTPNQLGSTDIIILINKKSLDAVVSSDNRGSKYLGAWQTSATASTNGILGLNERTTVRGIVASPAKELRSIDVQQEYKLGKEGTTLKLEASRTKTIPGETLDDTLNVHGDSDLVGVTVTHPFLRSRLENLNVRGTFDGRNSTTDYFKNIRQKSDRIRSARIGASYDLADKFNGVNTADFQVSKGIDGLGATEDGQALRTRINGKQDYTKVNLDVSRTQNIKGNVSLFAAASGQYAFDSLLSSEQFQIGGPAYGTGYDPGELSGDHGAAAKLELRYGDALGYRYLNSYQLYGYYDIGAVWLKNPLASERNRTSLASAGIGVRANITQSVYANLEWAFPLTKDLGIDPGKDSRVYGGVSYRY